MKILNTLLPMSFIMVDDPELLPGHIENWYKIIGVPLKDRTCVLIIDGEPNNDQT